MFHQSRFPWTTRGRFGRHQPPPISSGAVVKTWALILPPGKVTIFQVMVRRDWKTIGGCDLHVFSFEDGVTTYSKMTETTHRVFWNSSPLCCLLLDMTIDSNMKIWIKMYHQKLQQPEGNPQETPRYVKISAKSSLICHHLILYISQIVRVLVAQFGEGIITISWGEEFLGVT